MSTSDHDPVQRKLELEWYAAIATLAVGFIVALAVATYLTFSARPETANATTAAPTATQPALNQQARKAQLIKFFEEFCQLELATAQNFGIVPNYGKLASALPRKTDLKGRYVCLATTDAAKYQLVGDLMCTNLRDPHCVSLFTVSQADGTVLYQKQN